VLFHPVCCFSVFFRYGKFGSTPEEIEEATKSAQMHDRVMSFPDGACVWCMCSFSDLSWLTRLQYQSWRTWSSFEWGRETACSDRENSTEKPSYPFVGWSHEVNALWSERNQMFTPFMQCSGYFDREGHTKGSTESSSRSFLTFDRTSAIGKLFNFDVLLNLYWKEEDHRLCWPVSIESKHNA